MLGELNKINIRYHVISHVEHFLQEAPKILSYRLKI